MPTSPKLMALACENNRRLEEKTGYFPEREDMVGGWCCFNIPIPPFNKVLGHLIFILMISGISRLS